MPSTLCPHCGYHSNLTERWKEHYDFDGDQRTFACYTCDHCMRPVAAEIQHSPDPWADDGFVFWPSAQPRGKDFPDAPQAIANAASQAYKCLDADAPLGAVALARAAVESVAKDKGITNGTLESKINKLHERGFIGEDMKEAAHEIRFAGNEAAHGDLVDEPLSANDATDIVGLMDTILARVYEEPAKVARIRATREARRRVIQTATASIASADDGFSDEPPF